MKTPFALALICLWVCSTWVGCSVIIPQSSYTWSENYALDKNGGRCSSPQMNDGNKHTFGRTGIYAIGTRTDTVGPVGVSDPIGPAGVYDTELKVYPKVTVKFRQNLAIDKIVIHATNLDYFAVYWQDGEGNWQPLTSGRNNEKNPVIIIAHAVTDAIRIRAKTQKTVESMKTYLREPNLVELQLEVKIAEIEVYGKKVKG